jgi:hypothetical protein
MKKTLLIWACFLLLGFSSFAQQAADPMEGKWLSLHNPGDAISNTMHIFEDGIRYTYYCIGDDCEAEYESFEAGDENAIPLTHEYTFQDGVLTMDLDQETPITFECDSNRINFGGDRYGFQRLGTNCNVDEELVADPMEGKWLSLHNPGDAISNTMYIFKNGIRYTYYCVEGDCEAQYESFQAGDENAIPAKDPYIFKDGVLTIDPGFGNVRELPLTFECDSNRINFENSYDLQRLGTNCNVDEIISEDEISIEDCNFPYTHDLVAIPNTIEY